MADKMDTNQYLGAFLDEAGDNLEHLNELLLSAEQNQSDMGIINEIFRVAHTFKGMAATMGFQSMAALTHAMEDVLGLVRSGNLLLTSDDVDILFKCLDTLTAMVDSIRSGHSDADIESDHLTKVLHARRDHPEGAIADAVPGAQEFIEEHTSSGTHAGAPCFTEQELDWIASAETAGMQVYEIKVILGENCMLKAARAYMVVTLVGDLGDILKAVPSVENLEKEAFGRDFTIYAASRNTLQNIISQVERIGEVIEVNGKEVDVKNLKASPEKTPERAEHPDAVSSSKAPEEAADIKPAAPPHAPHADEHQKTGADAKKDASKAGNRTVRVDIGRLDKLMNLVGELVIGRARIERLVQESRLKAFADPLSQLGRISGDIQELVTKLRMVPVSMVFDRLPRLVRDLSRQMGKEIQLQVEGAETELDRTVIDEIGDPMVHVLRNSLDHGIETPDVREASGKPRTGTIVVAAYQEGNGVIIEVKDDGAGIDPDKVKKKALERGIITPEQAAAFTEAEAAQLVMLPGFSTADKITDLSGRGVGTDAIKNKVESLGGQFLIYSKFGSGTRVVIRLPLTLAIVLALLIKVGEETYAISLENVEETLLVHKKDIKYVHGTPVTTVRGEILPLSDLSAIIGTPDGRSDAEENPVVVVRVGRNRSRVGFLVDAFVGQQEIVIKPLGKLLLKVKGIAGATILGDGNVALILDAASL
ncbi:MAG: chemotaxis protein CheA [Synergistaceae bacterium]|jgi:two-component system chemotaxis sensor kinase CheA|nr:chemotaxis protein CheA [Synergistaceae bacterium]